MKYKLNCMLRTKTGIIQYSQSENVDKIVIDIPKNSTMGFVQISYLRDKE